MVPDSGGQARHEPPFDLVASKLVVPTVRWGSVARGSLLERITRSDAGSIVSIVAPAGYGKTTLLSQWAERDRRPFAWVSLDDGDNDPKVLLTYVAVALERVGTVPRRVMDALTSAGSSVPGTVVPRLAEAFASLATPIVLVLDDVDVVRNTESRAALSVLADHVPPGSQLVFSGRTTPPLRIARLRAEGRVTEVDIEDLALTVEEAALLLRGADAELEKEDVAELHRRTEGWPVGLYLAALYLRHSALPHAALSRFAGNDRFVGEYIESEFLSQISASQRAFLTRAAALDRISGPLVEAVLGLPGASATLAVLAQSNLLLVPIDHRGQWYRFHHLFRDLLQAELVRGEPDLLPAIRRRAARWCAQHGLLGEAIEYAILAEDVDAVAHLLPRLWGPLYGRGRTATLHRWLAWLEARDGVEREPLNAVNAGFAAAATGHPAEAERWAHALQRWRERDGAPSDPAVDASALALRALLCEGGPEAMRADADRAAQRYALVGAVPPHVLLLQGTARVLTGESDAAEPFLAEAASPDHTDAYIDAVALASAERAITAMRRHDWATAESLLHNAERALEQGGIEDSAGGALVCALQPRLLLHRGRFGEVRDALAAALRHRDVLTRAVPYWAVQARLAMRRAQLALDDLRGARQLLAELDDILRSRTALGTLVAEVAAAREQARGVQAGVAEGGAFTAAELRVLPMLATHLNYSEIASELHISTNTVKSQAYSAFRKLGATSRTEAVTLSRKLALIDV